MSCSAETSQFWVLQNQQSQWLIQPHAAGCLYRGIFFLPTRISALCLSAQFVGKRQQFPLIFPFWESIKTRLDWDRLVRQRNRRCILPTLYATFRMRLMVFSEISIFSGQGVTQGWLKCMSLRSLLWGDGHPSISVVSCSGLGKVVLWFPYRVSPEPCRNLPLVLMPLSMI